MIALVQGEGAFSRLKFEGGVHRVQRVPVTEAQGRIHTSAVTVAVLPEAEDVEVDLTEKDLRIDVFRSSGPGGQSVNTTDSAVRVTHLPTGLVVTCQDEKSQHKNKAKALKILRARLLERARQEQQAAIAANRRAMVGSGDRSEKIRTYNFPQSRVTDHRINLTLHQLDRVLDGDLDAIIDALATKRAGRGARGGVVTRAPEQAAAADGRRGAGRRGGAAARRPACPSPRPTPRCCSRTRSATSRAGVVARRATALPAAAAARLEAAARAARARASPWPTSSASASSGRCRSRSTGAC